MQCETIEELVLELTLYPNRKIEILEDYARQCKYGWFAVAKDGNCALFDMNGELDDIKKVKTFTEFMVPKNRYFDSTPNAATKINIPDGVINIANWAFYNNDNIETVIIPDSVVEIGSYAFYSCDKLFSISIG